MSPLLTRNLLAAARAVLFIGISSGIAAQEHSYAPADIEAGAALYRSNCLGCHGDEADAVEGADLSNGRFRYGSTDEDLIRIIRAGLPNTPMAPQPSLSVGQARTIVAFLRSLPGGGGLDRQDGSEEVRVGSSAAGEQLFFGGAECGSCHGVNGGGSLLSPELGNVGGQRSPASLQQAMLRPDAEIRPEHRFYRVVTREGREVLGKLMNQDTHSVQMMNGDEHLVSFQKSNLSEHGFIGSPMPSYRDLLSDEQVADLVAYMLSLRGENTQ